MSKNMLAPTETINGATTDRNGRVFLLTKVSFDYWKIRSADKLVTGKGHQLLAAGDEMYVKREWDALIERERNAVASNYLAFIQNGLRQSV